MTSKYEIINDPLKLKPNSWAKFIKENKGGNIFQSPDFYYAIAETKLFTPAFIACVDSGSKQICGSILGTIQKDYTGILGYFTRRCIIVGGPVVQENQKSLIYDLLLHEMQISFQSKAFYFEFQFLYPIENHIKTLFEKYNYLYYPYMNIVVNTSLSKDALWEQIHKSRKKGIAKGAKQTFTFSKLNSFPSIDQFDLLLKETYKRARKPYPKVDYWKNLYKKLGPEKCVFFSLYYNSMPIIIMIAFRDQNRLFGYYVGIVGDSEILALRPVDFFYWKVLLWCNENSVEFFDWMGAGIRGELHGIAKFKLQYGGEFFENGRMSKYCSEFSGKLIGILFRVWRKLKYNRF